VPFPGASAPVFTEHAASRHPIALGPEPTIVRLQTADDDLFLRRVRAAAAAHRPFYLRVAGVRITRQPGVSYAVHLDPPLLAAPDRASRSYIGTINVFGAVVRGGHTGPGPAPHTNPRNYSFVITEAVPNRLHRLSAPPTVMLVPTGPLRPGGAPTVDAISLVSS
jgi:hypothetical protein